MTITTSSATRTTACTTCVPTYTYTVLVADTNAAVSPSVFTSVTSNSITINTSSPQPDISFVLRATDTSISPQLTLDVPFTVAWVNACDFTTFTASTMTVAAITNYVSVPTSPVVSLAKIFKDSASTNYGNHDGYTLCSPRTYSFSGPSQASLLFYNTVTNAIEIAGPTSISDYSATPLTINLEVCLTNYPGKCSMLSF